MIKVSVSNLTLIYQLTGYVIFFSAPEQTRCADELSISRR